MRKTYPASRRTTAPRSAPPGRLASAEAKAPMGARPTRSSDSAEQKRRERARTAELWSLLPVGPDFHGLLPLAKP